ncbi:MAG: type IV pilus assembly protein PilM [Candidatus Magasanikbacteria bacterium]|nr:type IV pilus assembly protein PilM [Candidatus Magasanikbacteria bacterium]
MLINPFQGAYGLDLGDRSVKIVQLRRKRKNWRSNGYILTHASHLELPEGLIDNGEIQKPEEVIQLLKKHLAKKECRAVAKIPWAAVCLPETKTYIQLIKIAAENHKMLKEMVGEAAPSHIPFETKDVYFDFEEILEKNVQKGERAVLLAAAPKNIVDSYTYLLNIAGLVPLAFEVEATAIVRAVINRRKDLSKEARGILDLGATRSSFIIFDQGVIQFSLSLPISGIKITNKIQEALRLEYAEAEKLKKECGLERDKNGGKLRKVLEEILEDLSQKLFRAIQFYKIHFPDHNPLTGIRLCGGGANLPALENFLSARLKLKIRKANPWVNLFSKNYPPLPLDESLTYATAVGLALRALENPLKI